MAYSVNPFLERRSERTTSDQEFALVFSPKVLEKLADSAFAGGVHIFRSAPGGGKTTILRAFTPSVLRSFWRAKGTNELKDSVPLFIERGVIDAQEGPRLLGVLISCASGYADLPPGASAIEEGPFRALMDCRVVIRALRSLGSYLGFAAGEPLSSVTLEYTGDEPLKSIPQSSSAVELAAWAENQERLIYAELDAFAGKAPKSLPVGERFESPLWLQSVRFIHNGEAVATKRLLMIDDLHRLRRRQRELLVDELTVQRPSMPVWLAMRTLVLGDALLSQGARVGRDINEYSLEELWGGEKKGISQFMPFAENVLDRRMKRQDAVSGSFAQHLRGQLEAQEVKALVQRCLAAFQAAVEPHQRNARYSEWLARAERVVGEPTVESLIDVFATRIQVARDAARPQMSLDMTLPEAALEEKDNSSLRAAAEIQLHEEIKLPYYFGLERLCIMASYNIEELLALAAALYDGVVAGRVLGRRGGPELAPSEQEQILQESVSRRLSFVPKNHTEGARAHLLLKSVGAFCQDKTFLLNAPYAPGVTGVRLSQTEMEKLAGLSKGLGEQGAILRRVLSECVAENLLMARTSGATTGREAGTIFYLNRSLCAHFGLPLQMGGWQDVSCLDLIDWMSRGRVRKKLLAVEN